MTGLYVHVPFCVRACPYCDFDFEVTRRPDVAAYLAGLGRELEARELPVRVDTVYFGGGTPSALGPAGLERLCREVAGRVDISGRTEWTVELNPEHATGEMLAMLRGQGVDRVSLGIQSFADPVLERLGRVHRGDEGRGAVERALEVGLRVSVDVIVGWPGQSPPEVVADLGAAAALGVGHVSIYALTVEPDTPWEALVRRGKRRLPVASEQAACLEEAERVLVGAGFDHYEVASYGRDGDRARHNLLYWSWRDYVGLGPSAHSATYRPDGSVLRRGNRRGLSRWLEAPGEPDGAEELGPESAAAEGLWLGLRRLEGFDLAELLERFPAVDEGWVRGRLARQVELGNVEVRAGKVRVMPGRWLHHDGIGADVL